MKFLFGKNKSKKGKSTIENMAKQRDMDGLSNALMDPDWHIREFAAESIEKIGIPNNLPIKARYLVAKRNFSEVISLGEVAKEPLLLALSHSDPEVHFNAAESLAKIFNADAVQPILDSIPEMDSRRILNIAILIGKIDDPIAADKLLTALRHSNAKVRWVAAYAIGEIGDNRALSALEQMAKSDNGKTTNDGPVSIAARIALEKIQWRERPLEQLINAINNSDEYIRFGAADALGRRGDISSVDALIERLNDSSRLVRDTVIAALGNIGDVRAVAPLTAIAKSKDTGFRWGAINSIEQIAGTPVDILIELLNDPISRFAAVYRLRKASDVRAIRALESVLKEDKNEGTKKYARESIEEIQKRINENN